jgi:hypothetical protein
LTGEEKAALEAVAMEMEEPHIGATRSGLPNGEDEIVFDVGVRPLTMSSEFSDASVCAVGALPARWWARRAWRMRRTRGPTKLAGRSYWREDDARRIVDGWRENGDPVSVFAARLGIDPRRFAHWARRLDDRPDEAFRFVPFRVVDDRPETQASIDIELGHGRRVRVAAGFAADDLRRGFAILDERMSC